MTPATVDADVPALPTWYDDLCSCLQTTVGCVLQSHDWDPVQALAAGWRFTAPKEPVEPVEYYHPAGDRLGEQLCLYHPVRLTWHRPSSAADARAQLRPALARGTAAIVAVNNFHLPFRPAYHDVHAAHLVVVTGLDETRDEAQVHDPMPPAFRGPLPLPVLDRARDSLAVEDGSDPFFAGSRPSWRWLEVAVDGPQPEPCWAWVRDAMRANLAALTAAGAGPAALASLLRRLPGGAGAPAVALRDLYVLGWPAQAEASLHGTFLATAAHRLQRPDLAEVARSVDTVAHGWTGFRVAAAHAARDGDADPGRVRALGRQLLRRWEDCLADYQRLAEEAT